MGAFSLFHVCRALLVTFVILYAGSWLVAVGSEALRRGRASAGPVRGSVRRRLRDLCGSRWRRDLLTIGGLCVALAFLILLHGWRPSWT